MSQVYQLIDILVLLSMSFKNALSSSWLLGSLPLKTSVNSKIKALTSYLPFCQALLHSKALDSFHYYPTFPFMLELFSRMHDIHIKLIGNTEHVYSITINQTLFCIWAHCLCLSGILKHAFLESCNKIKFSKTYFITVIKKVASGLKDYSK